MQGLKDAYTTKELVRELGVTRQAIDQRSVRESWQSRPRAGRGGGNCWLVSSMPESTRHALALAVAARIAQVEDKKLPPITPELFTVNTLANVPERGRERAGARALLVNMARNFLAVSGSPRTTAYEVFCHEYNRGAIEAPEWLREALPSVCRRSLVNWEKALAARGMAAVAGRHGLHRRGCGVIDSTPGMADVVMAHIYKFYEVTAEDVLDALKVTHKGRRLPSLRALQRWMRQYRADNPRTILKRQNPDAFRSGFQAAFGSRSADATRLNERWELDSSPADILLADGKRYALIGGIDVYTRRACLWLARTSSAQGVCSLLRRMLLDFGVPEEIKMDNGADYTSYQVTTALCDLQIRTNYCTPFSPEEKPHIERFFGTFQRHLRTQPGFIGHSVADRKAIESQRSFAERISRKKGMEEEKALWEMPYTPEKFQALCDHFCDCSYGERKHSSLGMSPNEAAALAAVESAPRRITDERALDILLLPLAGNNGIRTISKCGIQADNGTYIAAELGGRIGEDVQVRLDEDDAGYIYVFDLNGMFVCRAEDPELTGVSRRDIALAAKRFQRAVENQKAKEAKKLVAKVKPQELIPQIIEMQAQEAAKNRAERELRFGAEPSREYTTPALEQAALAAASRELAKPAPITAQEEAARAEFEARYATPKAQPETARLDITSCEAFLLFIRLGEKLQRREPLTPDQTRFYHNYPSTHHYESWQVQYNIHGERLFDGIEMAIAL